MISNFIKQQSENPLYNVGVLSVMGYVFFSIIPYATAGRYICYVLFGLSFLLTLLRGKIKWPANSWFCISLYSLVGVILVSALLSSDPADSLNLVKKDTLPFLIAFLILADRSWNAGARKHIVSLGIGVILAAFTFRTIMALWVDIETGFRFSFYKESSDLPRYLDFYAADSLYYAPIFFATILFAPISKKIKYMLSAVFALSLFEIAVSGVRTSFALVSLSILLLLVARFWHYRKYIALVIALSVFGAFVAKDYVTNPTLARYYTLVNPQTYRFGQDFSVSERTAIASGVLQIVEQHPLLGYGPGWKKLPVVAERLGFLAQWKASDRPIDQMKYNYFSLGEGRVNPHNFYLSLVFELGVFGVLAYISLLLAVLFKALSRLRYQTQPLAKTVALASVCYVVVYLIAGLAGGPWLPSVLLVLASSLLLTDPASIEEKISNA